MYLKNENLINFDFSNYCNPYIIYNFSVLPSVQYFVLFSLRNCVKFRFTVLFSLASISISPHLYLRTFVDTFLITRYDKIKTLDGLIKFSCKVQFIHESTENDTLSFLDCLI